MTITVEEVMQKIPSAFVPENSEGVDAVVHFRFSGPDAGEWNAVIHAGTCQVARGLPRSKPTVSLAADSAEFVRVVTGELDGMKAYMDGKIRITGDLLLAPRLIQLFRIPSTGK